MITLAITEQDATDLIECIDAAYGEGMGIVRLEVLRQLMVSGVNPPSPYQSYENMAHLLKAAKEYGELLKAAKEYGENL